MKRFNRAENDNVVCSDEAHSAVRNCCICHKPFADFSFYYNYTETSLEAVGDCCVEMLGDGFGMGKLYRRHPLKPNSPAPWEYDDFTFFLNHPQRSHRVRNGFELEYPELGNSQTAKVIVRRIAQWCFVKVLLNSVFSKNVSDDDDFLHMIFHIALEFKNEDQLICEDIRIYEISV